MLIPQSTPHQKTDITELFSTVSPVLAVELLNENLPTATYRLRLALLRDTILTSILGTPETNDQIPVLINWIRSLQATEPKLYLSLIQKMLPLGMENIPTTSQNINTLVIVDQTERQNLQHLQHLQHHSLPMPAPFLEANILAVPPSPPPPPPPPPPFTFLAEETNLSNRTNSQFVIKRKKKQLSYV